MNNNKILQLARDIIDIEIQALKIGSNKLGASFNQAVDIISQRRNGKVVVLGMGKSGLVAAKIAATMASTGTKSFFIHSAEAAHGDLGMISSEDCVIFISQSGNSEDFSRLLPYFKRHKIPIISFTGNPISNLAKYSDIVISTFVEKEACPLGLAPTASTTLAMAIGDALALCLSSQMGFDTSNFAETHPHGTLGRKLILTIHDIMLDFNKSPVVSPSDTISEVILKMNDVGIGFAVIAENDKPLGIFTDGDLRRCFVNNIGLTDTRITEVMSCKFQFIHPDNLAVNAVTIMQKFKINSLPVINDFGKLLGTINMRLLLENGVV